MDKLKLKWRVTAGGVAALVLMLVALFVLRSGARPLCHRAVDGAFQQWMLETGHTNVYPNANGIGSNSLALLEPFFGKDIQQYDYVPGLSYSDPKNLVLLYMRTQIHYTWHGDTAHTIFSPRRWMVLSPMQTAVVWVTMSISRKCRSFGIPGWRQYIANVPSTLRCASKIGVDQQARRP